jgi:Zn-dependent peptidase ImmA (M78 family)
VILVNYNDYLTARDLAWNVLIEEKIQQLPVSVGQICKNRGIQVRYYTPKDENDGFSTIIKGEPWIFVSDQVSPERQRFTAAHELGHILLGHVGQYELVNREPAKMDNPIEHAANVFASRLLAPACVLWALNAHTPEEIAKLCQISRQAAAYRAERMKILYDRNRFLYSPLERKVYAQFQNFIEAKRLERI